MIGRPMRFDLILLLLLSARNRRMYFHGEREPRFVLHHESVAARMERTSLAVCIYTTMGFAKGTSLCSR